MAVSKLETLACLLRAETYRQMPEGTDRDIALMAVALFEDAVAVEPQTNKMTERLDYLYNMVVQMDKKMRATTPSPTYPQ